MQPYHSYGLEESGSVARRMDELRLTPTSYVVLGVIALRGRTTSYQLGRYAQTSIDHFWPIQHAQLYREPKRLAAAGLLEVDEEPDGRRRQFFSITRAGRDALEAWLATPTEEVVELRDAGLVKLHFSALADPAARERLAIEQLALRRRRLQHFEDMAARYEDPDREAPALGMGLALERAGVAFWSALVPDEG